MTTRWFRVLGLAAAAIPGSGCGAVMNGATHVVTAHATPEDARLYVDGALVTGPVVLANSRRHRVMARAPGHRDTFLDVDPEPRAVPIVLDVLFFLPSLGTTLICDGLLGTFRRVPSEITVTLEPAVPEVLAPAPEYGTTPAVDASEFAPLVATAASEFGATPAQQATDYQPETIDLAIYARAPDVVAPPPPVEPVAPPVDEARPAHHGRGPRHH